METKERCLINQLQEMLEEEKYNEADNLLKDFVQTERVTCEEIEIIDAAIGEYFGDKERVWEAIRRGMLINPQNTELYLMLGNYYMDINKEQAYLCYENALFYCDDPEVQTQIDDMLVWMKESGVAVKRVSFVILSYNLLDYTKICINSIRATVPSFAREIVVVDNGSEDGSVTWLREQSDVVLVENSENVGFPKGCNQGICVSSEDTDILLLNNDTILPMNAVFWLRMGLYADDKNGTAGSVSNYVGNQQKVAEHIIGVENLLDYGKRNNVLMKYPYENKIFLIGFALLIRREIISLLGGLDERFSPGNSEDEDFGLQVLCAGYKNILCKNSFIFHFGSKSFGKNVTAYAELLRKNRLKLNEKWGISTQYYLYPRMELINLIEEPEEKKLNVLDIGCGCGTMLGRIKGKYPNACLYGVEIVPKVADIGKNIASVINADVEKMQMTWEEEFFDYIFMGDVLEHLHKPEDVLKKLRKYLKKDGHIIVSISNMKHYSVMVPLLKKDLFSYTEAGILDTTHLKMYTRTEIIKLLYNCGYDIEYLGYTMSGKMNETEEKMINLLASLMDEPDDTTFIAYQYILKAKMR